MARSQCLLERGNKVKLPSYTLVRVLEEVNPCSAYYTLERIKKMFPGRRRIIAKDVLKLPLKKFRRRHAGLDKSWGFFVLLPEILKGRLRKYYEKHRGSFNTSKSTIQGTVQEVKYALKLCDEYEKGLIE